MNELQRNPLFRITGLVILGLILVLTFQFARQFYIWIYYKILFLYSIGAFMQVIGFLDRLLPFNLSQPVFLIKIIASVVHLVCMIGIIQLWFTDWRITKRGMFIIIGWFAAGIILNLIGKTSGDADVLLSARTLIDYLLQPFGIAFLVPVLILYRKQLPPLEKNIQPLTTSKSTEDDEIIVVD